MRWRSHKAFQQALVLAIVVVSIFYLKSHYPLLSTRAKLETTSTASRALSCKNLSIPLAQRVRCIEKILERNGIDPSQIGEAEGLVPRDNPVVKAKMLAATHGGSDANGEGAGRRGVLCAVFMALGPENIATLEANIKYQALSRASDRTSLSCDWAVVIYGPQGRAGDVDALQELRRSAQREYGVKVSLLDSLPSLAALLAAHGHLHIQFQPSPTYYPKPLLYLQLAEQIASYEYVWLLDDDISLEGSQLPVVWRALHCAFSPSPAALVAQLLVREGSQSYSYLNLGGWAQRHLAVAAKSQFVELQAPLVDTTFLQWFLQSVVVPMMPAIAFFESDFGMDNVWCGAARAYSSGRLKYSADYSPCNIIIADQSVRHFDRKSSKAGLGKKKLKLKFLRDHQLILLFHQVFPEWFVFGHTESLSNFTAHAVSTHSSCAI